MRSTPNERPRFRRGLSLRTCLRVELLRRGGQCETDGVVTALPIEAVRVHLERDARVLVAEHGRDGYRIKAGVDEACRGERRERQAGRAGVGAQVLDLLAGGQGVVDAGSKPRRVTLR